MILANFHDKSLFHDFKVLSPVLKGAVRNFCGKNFHDFCVIHENRENFDYENLELYGITYFKLITFPPLITYVAYVIIASGSSAINPR